jgi:NAD(P)-dependent dehydrogenase (short-subunit alcohol dehydrogenase family)
MQGGENYNKWHAYGQSKTANMLMALSLAEKLGPRGLRAFSVHPGTIGSTSLGTHVDWAKEFAELRTLKLCPILPRDDKIV